ncbi:hypothetical protein BTVI_142046 [Pitangus sulphuratus]|nr:hypothetical protein BTVI_142046 [Pitangus sulphuratus]
MVPETKMLFTDAWDSLRHILQRVAEKFLAANLLLLKQLLALLQDIGHDTSTSRMSSSNLAICLGPNLLSPANKDLLLLEARLEVTKKVGWIEQLAAAFLSPPSLAA